MGNQCKQKQTRVLINRMNDMSDKNECGDLCKGSVVVAALLLVCLVVVVVKCVYDKRKAKKQAFKRTLNKTKTEESLDSEAAEVKLIHDLLNSSGSWPSSNSS